KKYRTGERQPPTPFALDRSRTATLDRSQPGAAVGKILSRGARHCRRALCCGGRVGQKLAATFLRQRLCARGGDGFGRARNQPAFSQWALQAEQNIAALACRR